MMWELKAYHIICLLATLYVVILLLVNSFHDKLSFTFRAPTTGRILTNIENVNPNPQIPINVENLVSTFYSELRRSHHEPVPSCPGKPLVTFIIPTKLRPSLIDTLSSLQNQTNCNWKAIIVYQTVYGDSGSSHMEMLLMHAPDQYQVLFPPNQLFDTRITFLESKQYSEKNFAGGLRNDAISLARTEWVAFVDDDDTLTPDYISSLQEEITLTPAASVIVFRMLCNTCFSLVVPPRDYTDLIENYVGVSFAMKRSLTLSTDKYKFRNGPVEDYCLLYEVRNGDYTLVISPSVTYLANGMQSEYLHELLKINNTTRSVIHAPVGSVPPRCGHNSFLSTPAPRSHELSGFVFPEERVWLLSRIFQQNIDGLRISLNLAFQRGCLLPWIFKIQNIEIHFSYDTPVKKGVPYIQVQLEQIHNRSNVFSKRYIKKLKQAQQVWVIAPSHFTFIRSYLNVKQTYYVPLWLMVDPNDLSESFCLQQQQVITYDNSVVSFVRNTRRYSSLSPARSDMLENCLVVPEDGLSRNRLMKRTEELPLCPLPKVVMFGLIVGSDSNRRMNLCLYLMKNLNSISQDTQSNFGCFQKIYRPALDIVLCSADIVVVDRYYSFAALESHRIDPLLKAGKIVVSTRTEDKQLERSYQDAVIFTDTWEDLLTILRDLLTNVTLSNEHKQKGIEFIRRKSQILQPLCAAITDLQKDMVKHLSKSSVYSQKIANSPASLRGNNRFAERSKLSLNLRGKKMKERKREKR